MKISIPPQDVSFIDPKTGLMNIVWWDALKALEQFPGNNIAATSSAGAVTVNAASGVITTEALTTAAGADYAFTLTNNVVNANSVVHVAVGNGTNTTFPAYVHSVQVSAGQVTFKIRNAGAAALNGTLAIMFAVF